ncbi:MAG: phosphopantetheine-binding protein, partial [bacterium]|nr:phosphopantetheine-binding protein [bacterium]
MARASDIPGGMAAVSGSSTPIQSLLDEMATEVVIANQNSPQQTVISGPKTDLAEVQKKLEQVGLKVTPLKVATAFHSSLVSPSARDFLKYLKGINIKAPKIPVYSNQRAKAYPSDPEEIRKYMAEHLANPVRFEDEIKAMQKDGANLFIEVGPGSTLSGLIKECLNGEDYQVISLDMPKKNGITGLLNALAQLSALGMELNLEMLRSRELPLRDKPEASPTTVTISSANYDKRYPVPGEDPAVQARSRDPFIIGKGASVSGINKLMSLLEKRKKGKAASSPEPKEQALAVGAEAFHKTVQGEKETAGGNSPAPYTLQSMPPPPPPSGAELSNSEREKAPEPSPAAPEPETPAPSSKSASIGVIEGVEKLKALLLNVISETTGYPEDVLAEDMNLEADLGIDSIKRVEIFMEINQRVPNLPEVKVDQLAELQTIGQIVEFINNTAGEIMERGSLDSVKTSEPVPNSPLVPELHGIEKTSAAQDSGRVENPAAKESSVEEKPKFQDKELEQLKEILFEVISSATGYPLKILSPEMQLEGDLGIDSIKRVEIFMTVNERVPNLPEVQFEELVGLETIGDILDFMNRTANELRGQTPQATEPAPQVSTQPEETPSPEKEVSPEIPVEIPVKEEIKIKHANIIKRVEVRLRTIEEYTPKPFNPMGEVLLINDSIGVAPALAEVLKENAIPHRVLEKSEAIEEDWNGGSIIYLAGLKPLQHFYSGTKLNKQAFQTAKRWIQGIEKSGRKDGVCFITVQDLGGDFGLSKGDRIHALRGGLSGLSKTLAKEYPETYVKAIDIDTEDREVSDIAKEI